MNLAAIYTYSLAAYDNSTIRVKSGATSNLNGGIDAARGGVVRVQGGATVTNSGTGTVGFDAYDGGFIRFDNSTQSGGYISAFRNSNIRIGGTSTINATGFYIEASLGSNIVVPTTFIG